MKNRIVVILTLIVLLALFLFGCIKGPGSVLQETAILPPKPNGTSCTIFVTNPGYHDSLNGSGTCNIEWSYNGPTDKKGDIILIGYTKESQEIGRMLIADNISLANESYVWGPEFGFSIEQYFGTDVNWPYWFEIEIEAEDCGCWAEFFSVYWAPSEIEVTKWGITNLWESSTLHRFLNEIESASGYSIDCIIDVYVANDDPIWLVEIKLSTGEVIALYKEAPGHYSMHLQRYTFSWDRYINCLSALAELLAKSLGNPTFRISDPDYPPEIAIAEIIITDKEINIHHITWSEAGQVLPERVPTYEGALSAWTSGGGTLFLGHSPVDFLVENSQGRRVGALYESGFFIGEINEIPDAFYGGQGLDLQFIYIPDSFGDCIVEVIGRGTGDYILDVLTFEKEEDTTFTATDIPTLSGAIHQYTIDWNVLSQGGEGVTVQIDFDGDGTFELTITTGSTFIFIPATIDIDPDTLNLNSKIKWVTAYIEFPEDYDVTNIDVSTVNLWYEGNNVPAEWGDIQQNILMVKFNGVAIQEILEVGDEIKITVTGDISGVTFEGSDTIRVIEKP